ncbi:MAG: hypothetical protein MZV63_15170 [Marinilabiliales bacterium]|nr:hypothetical protein [Marinilabiliales bacterium]
MRGNPSKKGIDIMKWIILFITAAFLLSCSQSGFISKKKEIDYSTETLHIEGDDDLYLLKKLHKFKELRELKITNCTKVVLKADSVFSRHDWKTYILLIVVQLSFLRTFFDTLLRLEIERINLILKRFPPGLENDSQLTYLDLADNKISVLNDSIKQCF